MSHPGPLGPPPVAYGPPYPARERDRGVIAAIVTGLVVVVLACAGGLALGFRRVSTDRVATVAASGVSSATPSVVPSGTPSDSPSSRDHSGDLRRFLLKMPDTADPWNRPLGTNGHLTVAQESALAPHPDLRAALFHRYDFVQGAAANWVESDGTSVDIRLFRFARVNSAVGFFKESKSAAGSSNDFTFAQDDDVPFSEIIISSRKDKYGQLFTHSLAYRGDVVIEMWINDRGPVSLPFTRRLLTAQWNRL